MKIEIFHAHITAHSLLTYKKDTMDEGIEIAVIIEEFKFYFEVGISNISKLAIVTDKKWLEKIVSIEDKIFKSIEMKCFSIEDKDAAIAFLKNA